MCNTLALLHRRMPQLFATHIHPRRVNKQPPAFDVGHHPAPELPFANLPCGVLLAHSHEYHRLSRRLILLDLCTLPSQNRIQSSRQVDDLRIRHGNLLRLKVPHVTDAPYALRPHYTHRLIQNECRVK